MSKILVKQASPQVGVGMGSGGPGLAFMVGGEKVMQPDSEKFQDMYGEKGSDSHTRAMNMQNLGRMGRYGLAGLSAFNSAYNQTSSGQPGVIGAAGSGAMQGFYGSAGLEDFAARAGQKYGRKLSRDSPVDTTAQPALAAPTQHSQEDYVPPADFEVIEDPQLAENNASTITRPDRLLASPTANSTGGKVAVSNPYNAMTDEYGRPKSSPYDAIREEF